MFLRATKPTLSSVKINFTNREGIVRIAKCYHVIYSINIPYILTVKPWAQPVNITVLVICKYGKVY